MSASGRDDGPVRLLRTGVFMLAAGRSPWGRAMLAELAQVQGRRRRWAFALGCIRCLAFTMPPSGAQRAVTSGALAAAIASLSLVAVAFWRYPGMVSGPRTWVAVVLFVAVLTSYVVTASNAAARGVETRLTWASVLSGVLVAATWLGVGVTSATGGTAASTVVLLVLGPVVALVLGWLVTARSASRRVGLGCVGLTALTAGLVLFPMWAGWTVITAGRPYDVGLLRDFRSSGFPDLATYAVNDSLGTGMVLLLLVPLLTAVSGSVGAAAARIIGTERST